MRSHSASTRHLLMPAFAAILVVGTLMGCGGASDGSTQSQPQPQPQPTPLPYPGNTPLPAGLHGIYLRKATADLRISSTSATPTYLAYFHIPIAFEDQAPFLLTLSSPELIDYRFLRTSSPNVLVAARLKQGPTVIHWESWVAVKANEWSGVPATLSLSTLSTLPEDVKPWLQPSDCVQFQSPFIQGKAAATLNGTTDLMALANQVAQTCGNIGYDFSHTPWAFDAFYALNWGNSCTGHAHAGAALLRANGVPARVLLNMPSWEGIGLYDQHWIVQYYIPSYGWARMETTLGENLEPPQDELITMACAPGDEFPLFYPEGIEAYWHTSDPAMPVIAPDWGAAHTALGCGGFPSTSDAADQAIEAAAKVFADEVDRKGLALTTDQQAAVAAALPFQQAALASLQTGDVSGFTSNLQQAAAAYENLSLDPLRAVFSEDFESGGAGWTHGGTQDSWTLGTPNTGSHPPSAHSGTGCYGTGFSGDYPSGADSWLLSPPFSLQNLSGATLSFWVYNWVLDVEQGVVGDPLWVELTTDGGATFQPVCSQMGGVNEDPDIPAVGGWANMFLDLFPFLGNKTVQVRFRFKSNSSGHGTPLPGSYIDDIQVAGRPIPK